MVRFTLLLLVLKTFAAEAVTLSEIMFDPLANEGTDEFIELYNESGGTILLENWRVTDGADTDRIITLDQGLLLAAGQFVLILDPDYIDNGSTTYDGIIPDDALVVTIDNSTIGSRGLSNSTAETISLLNPAGQAVSVYQYSLGNSAGHTDEKRVLTGANDETNWGDSQTLYGTPGASNSITPPQHDLAIVSLRSSPPVVELNEVFSILVRVANQGVRAAGANVQIFEVDPAQSDSLIPFDHWTISSLGTGDSLLMTSDAFTLQTPTRTFRVEVDSSDDRPNNNTRTLLVRAGGSRGGLLINEIMYSPSAGRAEWVELVNASGTELDLSAWEFADGSQLSDSTSRLTLPRVTLAADSLLIVASDSNIYFERMPATTHIAVYEDDFATLNNAGDSLAVFDADQVIVDRVDYRSTWGGESGVSLERRSIASASDDESNWASAEDSSGSTPGRANSLSELSTPGEQMLELTPNPFAPSGDGHSDKMAIHYSLSYTVATLDLKVYDIRGRKVRSLLENAEVGSSGSVLWNGTDDQGRQLPTGMYVVYAEAAAASGSRLQKSKRIATIVRPR